VKWQSPLKTNPAAPHQGRRHAAHRSGGQSLYAQIVKGSRAPRLRMGISNRSAVAQRQYRRVYLTVSVGHGGADDCRPRHLALHRQEIGVAGQTPLTVETLLQNSERLASPSNRVAAR
jgi:hypothetical protein